MEIKQGLYFTASRVGLFEGGLTKSMMPGTPGHSHYIRQKREEAYAPVVEHIYPDCGHDAIGCGKGHAWQDMLKFLVGK